MGSKVIICSRCDASGTIREDVGYHQSEYEFHKCTDCNGTGRIIQYYYSYEVPFGTDRDILYKLDKQIRDLILAMKKEV